MVAPARGLSPIDLGAVRQALTVGRHPKVVFTKTAGQIAGQVGQVVALTDPAATDEWIVVRFGRDELPFAAHDLAMPIRGRSPRAKPTTPEPAPAPAREVRPGPAASGLRSAGSAATRATREGAASDGPGPRDEASARATSTGRVVKTEERRERSDQSTREDDPPGARGPRERRRAPEADPSRAQAAPETEPRRRRR